MIADSGTLSFEPTPGGGIAVRARIGRPGVQVYRRPDGSTVRAYRPPEDVFAADFTGAPITIGHPQGGVNPTTWAQHAKGVVLAQSKDPEVVDGTPWANAKLQVAVAEVQDGIRSGKYCECSCAYDCTRDWTPGVTADGEQYDVVFRNYKPNHVALGGKGFARAGRDARVLVADGEQMTDVFSDTAFIADSDDKNPSAPAPASADIAVLTKLISDSAAEIAVLKTENAKLQAQVDAANKAATDAAASLPKQIADGVSAELAFRAKVTPHLPKDFKFTEPTADGKSEVLKSRRSVLSAAVLARDPKFVINDSVQDAYLEAYVDAAAKYAQPHDFNQSQTHVADGTTNPGATKDPAKHIAESTKDLWKGK